MADIPVTGKHIAAMGVGGLLTEIPSRPQPREEEHTDAPHAPRIAAVVLAAGLSSRMGENKLLVDISGLPLIRRTVETALKSHASPVIVVTGRDAPQIEQALKGLDVRFAKNEDFAKGLSTSLKTGLRNIPVESDGTLIVLGDMPSVTPTLLDTPHRCLRSRRRPRDLRCHARWQARESRPLGAPFLPRNTGNRRRCRR